MRSGVQITLFGAAFFVAVGTSAWTINEIGKNNRAIWALNSKVDRLTARFMIAGYRARAANPIVIFGDSITEWAMLPDKICGHAVVNAGIGGANVGDLVNFAPLLFEDKSPALVVIAIGTNDAHAGPNSEAQFSASYTKLLQRLSLIAPKLAVASIPAVDPKGALTVAAKLDASLVDRFNMLLPKLAEEAGASFIDVHDAVSAKGPPATPDGVHLAPSAYDLWEGAMLTGIKKALNCDAIGSR